jgi:hypothetical protein
VKNAGLIRKKIVEDPVSAIAEAETGNDLVITRHNKPVAHMNDKHGFRKNIFFAVFEVLAVYFCWIALLVKDRGRYCTAPL